MKDNEHGDESFSRAISPTEQLHGEQLHSAVERGSSQV